MKTLFHTIVTSERHRKMGYCEPSDFGKIELIELEPEEKELIVSFKRYSDEPIVEYIKFNDAVYKKVQVSDINNMSREEQAEQFKKQGKYSPASAIKLMLNQREGKERSFSYPGDTVFILIGKTLYKGYSELDRLNITVASNLLFSYWLSIDIEWHGGKQDFPLSRTSFQKVFKEQKARFEKNKPEEGTRRGGGLHDLISFSYPKSIKWGKNFL